MPGTLVLREFEVPHYIPLRAGPAACVHDAVWVVELASRRVVRAACAECASGPPTLASPDSRGSAAADHARAPFATGGGPVREPR